MKTIAILSALIAAGATHGQNILTVSANVADGETFTIGTDVFEFTTDDTPTAGRLAVDISGGLTPTTVRPAIVAAINDGTAYSALEVGTGIVVIHDRPGVSVACSETMAQGANVWAAAALYGHAAKSNRTAIPVTLYRAATAAEVTAGVIAFGFAAPIETAGVQVRTAAGVPKAIDGKISISGHILAIDASGSTDIAATDIVTVTARLAVVA